jgi:hypothetical protein
MRRQLDALAHGLERVIVALLLLGHIGAAAAQSEAQPEATPAIRPAAPSEVPPAVPPAAPTAAAPVPCEPHLSNPQFRRLEAQIINGTRYAIAWIAVPDVRVSEFFTVEIAVCAAPGQPPARTLRIDATMPEHQHGMNYRASVRPRGPGRFVAEGMLLHMPGRWEISFEINVGAQRELLTGVVQVN